MPTYVVLVNWTDQGIRNVKHTIERTDSGGEIAEKHGLKLEQTYWMVGAYDMVTVFEPPGDEAMSAHLLEIGSLGNVRTNHAKSIRRGRDVGDTPEARLSTIQRRRTLLLRTSVNNESTVQTFRRAPRSGEQFAGGP
jgi:uncharacterized protein with GYD domain